ncbi:MAG: D-alanyl-D-alanine carboxypeptidase/D-alanyl-D-alanine-endopeptidase [Candidatus Abyssubacteria bacterium]
MSSPKFFKRMVIFTIAPLILVSAVCFAEASKQDILAERIDSIIAQSRQGACTWSIEVVSLDTGKTLYEKNARLSIVPASNTKLFTTAAALHYLGPDFTIKTSFYFDGALDENGTLNGDLVIYGRGDPNISGRFTNRPTQIFEEIANSLVSLGLRTVGGDVIGDDSYFDSRYYGPWPDTDSNRWYAARVSALSFNDNCLDIRVSPSTPGLRANISKSPWTSYVKVVNRATTTNRRKNSVWFTPTSDGKVVIHGQIWTGRQVETLYVPVDNPTLYTTTVFKETLERSDVRINGKARVLRPNEMSVAHRDDAALVAEYESPPLSEMIKIVNKRSQNLHAELLLKQIGRAAGFGGSFEGGVKAVERFLLESDLYPIDIKDGSGLCRSNRASAHSIVQLLKHMDSTKWAEVYRDSLAVAGVDNSLRSMAGTVPNGSVVGKTGSLKKVIAFSGYATGKTERLAFSIIANDFEESYRVREARDRICRELARY